MLTCSMHVWCGSSLIYTQILEIDAYRKDEQHNDCSCTVDYSNSIFSVVKICQVCTSVNYFEVLVFDLVRIHEHWLNMVRHYTTSDDADG